MLSAWKNCSTLSCGDQSELVRNPIVGNEVEKEVKILIVMFDTVILALPITCNAPECTGESDSVNV